jgi:hypothetical protein
VIAVANSTRIGVRLARKPVAVRRPPAISVALSRVLRLPPTNLSAELFDLELVERLKETAHEAALGTL